MADFFLVSIKSPGRLCLCLKNRVKNIVVVQHGFHGFIEDHLAEALLNRHVQNINLSDGSHLGVDHGRQRVANKSAAGSSRMLQVLHYVLFS